MTKVTEVTLDKQAKLISQWNNDPEFGFDNRCVFIDEAGFNLHIYRNFGRSKRASPTRAVIPLQRGVPITILDAICELGVINVFLRSHSPYKAIRNESEVMVACLNVRVGTRTEHFIAFFNKIIDILNKNDIKGRYVIMAKEPIHTNQSISRLVEQRGYKCTYLAPYSPFLNPIEEVWSKVKLSKYKMRLALLFLSLIFLS